MKSQQHASDKRDKNFRRLLYHAWEKSTFYRDYYASHGIKEKDLAGVSVRDLPLLTKKILMENFDLAVTDPRLRRQEVETWAEVNVHPEANFRQDFVVIRTSGTSGYQGTIVYAESAWRLANAFVASHLPPPSNYPATTKMAWYVDSNSRGGGVSLAKRIPSNLYETLIVSLLENPVSVVEKLNAFQPHRLTGYSSVIADLARWALEGKLRIFPIDVIVSGDLMTDGMKRTIQDAWNARITVIYAASESLYIAVKRPTQEDLQIIEELNLVEVLDSNGHSVAPGERGRVAVTNVYNYALPILRYELGDYVEAGQERDGCVTSIRSLKGRPDDGLPVILKDGRRGLIHPMVLPFFVAGVEKMQFVSQRPDHVRVYYVGIGTLDAKICTEFQQILEAFGADGTTFEVCKVPHIPNDPKTGKFVVIKLEPVVSDGGEWHSDLSKVDGRISVGADEGSRSIMRFPREDIERSIPDRFAQQVHNYPDRIAVKTKSTRFTYAELNAAANRLARTILEQRGQGQEAIVLLLENGAPIIAAILGVLKAGKLYMPLDPSYPQARIKAMLEDSQTGLILTNRRHLELANESAGSSVRVVNVDDLDSSLSSENLELALSADTLACILYTSGSTGEPKGVVHSHRNILHKTMEYTNALHFCSEDRMAVLSPCTFSLSVGFIFGALLNGACIYPVDVKGEGLTDLASRLAEEGVTVYNSVPSVFRNFVYTLTQEENLPKLRLVHLGGEPVTARDVDLYKKHFSPDCILLNHVGSNETGTIAQCFIDKKTPLHGNTVPAGHPSEGRQILVFDEDGKRVGFNRVAEIAVQSRYLAVGYWRKPEMTRAAFLPDPAGSDERIYRTGDLGLLRPDGSLEHHGRKDFQVKIRGQRVEVFEIDLALSKHTAVKEAVTVARDDAVGDKCLMTYVVTATTPAPTSKELRLFLQQQLPDYMVPSSIVFLDAMPLTPNGKLDRQALPLPDGRESGAEGQFVAPQNSVEEQIAGIWREVLRLDRVGIHDDFFDLGGHSLSATQVVSRARDVFDVELPLGMLLANPTVAELSLAIVELQAEGAAGGFGEVLTELQQLSEEEAQEQLREEHPKLGA